MMAPAPANDADRREDQVDQHENGENDDEENPVSSMIELRQASADQRTETAERKSDNRPYNRHSQADMAAIIQIIIRVIPRTHAKAEFQKQSSDQFQTISNQAISDKLQHNPLPLQRGRHQVESHCAKAIEQAKGTPHRYNMGLPFPERKQVEESFYQNSCEIRNHKQPEADPIGDANNRF